MSRANQKRRTERTRNTARMPSSSPHAADDTHPARSGARITEALALCGFLLSTIDPGVLRQVITQTIVDATTALLAFIERAKHVSAFASQHADPCLCGRARSKRLRRRRAAHSPSTPDRRPS